MVFTSLLPIKYVKSIRDKTPHVKAEPLRIAASLLTCAIFIALLAQSGTPDHAMGHEDKNFSVERNGTYSSTSVRDLHTVPF
jgi:hypothetical protein